MATRKTTTKRKTTAKRKTMAKKATPKHDDAMQKLIENFSRVEERDEKIAVTVVLPKTVNPQVALLLANMSDHEYRDMTVVYSTAGTDKKQYGFLETPQEPEVKSMFFLILLNRMMQFMGLPTPAGE